MKTCSYCGRENEDGANACSECGKALETPPAAEKTDPQLLDPGLAPVIVARFSSLQEASVLVGRLEAAGIEASIPEEYGEQVFSGVVALERMTVRVAAKDYAAAKAIMAESAETPPNTGADATSEGEEV